MATTRINARLDAETTHLLDQIAAQTGETTSEILRASLRLYGQRISKASNPAAIFSAHGFVGCADGPEDLSTSYKAQLTPTLERKT